MAEFEAEFDQAAWERGLATMSQAQLNEELLECARYNEPEDLIKVIEAGGDFELAAMYGLERVWEALDRLEKRKSLQSEKYQRLFAKFRRLQRAWQDDAEDPELLLQRAARVHRSRVFACKSSTLRRDQRRLLPDVCQPAAADAPGGPRHRSPQHWCGRHRISGRQLGGARWTSAAAEPLGGRGAV